MSHPESYLKLEREINKRTNTEEEDIGPEFYKMCGELIDDEQRTAMYKLYNNSEFDRVILRIIKR